MQNSQGASLGLSLATTLSPRRKAFQIRQVTPMLCYVLIFLLGSKVGGHNHLETRIDIGHPLFVKPAGSCSSCPGTRDLTTQLGFEDKFPGFALQNCCCNYRSSNTSCLGYQVLLWTPTFIFNHQTRGRCSCDFMS